MAWCARNRARASATPARPRAARPGPQQWQHPTSNLATCACASLLLGQGACISDSMSRLRARPHVFRAHFSSFCCEVRAVARRRRARRPAMAVPTPCALVTRAPGRSRPPFVFVFLNVTTDTSEEEEKLEAGEWGSSGAARRGSAAGRPCAWLLSARRHGASGAGVWRAAGAVGGPGLTQRPAAKQKEEMSREKRERDEREEKREKKREENAHA